MTDYWRDQKENEADQFVCNRTCHLGQNFVCSDSEWRSIQDEDRSGSRPHSFPGLCQT